MLIQKSSPGPTVLAAGTDTVVLRTNKNGEDEGTLNRNMELQRLRKWIYRSYAGAVGLEPDARYIHGTPLRPVVPLDTARGGLFVIGAYPSARFHQINRVNDVPVGDNLGPFEAERWFDGARVRVQPSAAELENHFLGPMGLTRADCWITDLVKVFLFKDGHRKKYEKLGARPPAGYVRDRFRELAKLSVPFLERELQLANPRLVVTLGMEVAGVLKGVLSQGAQHKLLVPTVTELCVAGVTVPAIHCAHPGILMRPGNDWVERHRKEFVPALRHAWRCRAYLFPTAS